MKRRSDGYINLTQTSKLPAAQAINDVICANQPPGTCAISKIGATAGEGHRRLGDLTAMAYLVTITQAVSTNTTTPSILVPTAATLNAALVARGDDNVVIATEPVQQPSTLSLTITTTAHGSSCLKGNEGPFCAVCSEGYFRPSAFQPCKACGDEAMAMLSAVVALVAMVILLFVFIQINRRAPSGLLRPFINLVQQLTVMLVRSPPVTRPTIQ